MKIKIDIYNASRDFVSGEIIHVSDMDTRIQDKLNKYSSEYKLIKKESDSGVISLYNNDILIEIYEYKLSSTKDLILNNMPNIKQRISS